MIRSQWSSDEVGRQEDRWPFISVIVPVRNEARCIRHTLTQLLEQDYDPRYFEVIVADGRSTDETRAIVLEMQKQYSNLHLVDNPGRWSSAGRNAAIEVAIGDYIVIVDGHCDVENPRYLQDVIDAFDCSGADCIGRPQPLEIEEANGVQRAIALARSSRLGHHPDSFIYSDCEAYVRPQSVAIAYRREVFANVGTFDERFDACEDVELNHRVDQAGYVCFFTPRAAVKYHPRATLKGLFRQMIRYGRGRARLLRKHPETFTLPGFIPALFVLGLLVGPVLSLLSSWCAMAFLGCVGVYLSLVLLFGMGLTLKERDPKILPLFPLIYGAIHIGSGSGILLELIKPGQPPRREAEATTPTEVPARRAA